VRGEDSVPAKTATKSETAPATTVEADADPEPTKATAGAGETLSAQGSKRPVAEIVAELAPVPEPALLADSETLVKDQYAERKAAIAELLADPDPKVGPLSWAFGKLGMWAHAYRFFDTARVAYANASLLRPADHRWPYLMGHLYKRLGDIDAARKAYTHAHRARPDDVPTLVWLAELELAEGNLDAAQGYADAALDLDPRCTQAHLIDGRIAYAREDYSGAIARLRQAQRYDLTSKKIRYALGLAYRAAGDLERAETLMARATGFDDGSDPPLMRDPVLRRMKSYNVGSQVLVRKGNAAAKRGHHDRALGFFEKALSQDPDRVTLRARYGRALVEAGRHAEAVAVLEADRKEFPEETVFEHHLAVAYLANGDSEKAEATLRSLVARDPKQVNNRYTLAQILLNSGRHELALAEFEKAIEGDPGRERFRLGRAFCLIALERYDEAVAALEEDLRVVPKAQGIPMLLVRLLASSPSEASRDAARSLELSKQLKGNRKPNLGFAETVAMAHAATGDFESAIAWQKAAVEGAEEAEAETALLHAKQRLARYEQHEPCRVPWFEGEEKTHSMRVRPPPPTPAAKAPGGADA